MIQRLYTKDKYIHTYIVTRLIPSVFNPSIRFEKQKKGAMVERPNVGRSQCVFIDRKKASPRCKHCSTYYIDKRDQSNKSK